MKKKILLIAFTVLLGVNAFAQDNNINPATVTPQSASADNPQLSKGVVNAPKNNPFNLIGTKAQELTLRDIDNSKVLLSEIKTPYVLLLFWDPECGHCKTAVPDLNSFYNSYLKKVGCEVMAVDLDGNKQEWTDYVKDNHLNWINVWDPNNESDFRKKYDVYSSPIMYLLDKNRNIIGKFTKADDMKEVLNIKPEKDKKTESSESRDASSGDDNTTPGDDAFNVYPNPFSDGFTLYLPEIGNKASVSMYSVDGKLVFQSTYDTMNSTLRIDVNNYNLAAGYYIVTVRTGKNVYTRKLVKD